MRLQKVFAAVFVAALVNLSWVHGGSFELRGNQFIAFKSFRGFSKSPVVSSNELILTSKTIVPQLEWDELIPSWNLDASPSTSLRIQVCAIYGGRATKWYEMGIWSAAATGLPRESVRDQKDGDGDVDTDTLTLSHPAREFRVRFVISGTTNIPPDLKFAGVSLLNSKTVRAPLPPNRAAWGKLVDVPERSQMGYPNGGVICSPTTVSMMMAHWSREISSPAIDEGVMGVVKGVYDPQWKGTGNWAFNTAYAGSFKKMRAYTARLSDVSELEDWIAQGIPVGLSLCYNLLRGQGERGNGHLVVCVGFTEAGDVIINDPGTSKNIRKTFPRANLISAWAYSKNACYIIYPEDELVPADRFAHWDSWTAKQHWRLK